MGVEPLIPMRYRILNLRAEDSCRADNARPVIARAGPDFSPEDGQQAVRLLRPRSSVGFAVAHSHIAASSWQAQRPLLDVG